MVSDLCKDVVFELTNNRQIIVQFGKMDPWEIPHVRDGMINPRAELKLMIA